VFSLPDTATQIHLVAPPVRSTQERAKAVNS
jgi:hypothetical protein